MRQSQLFCQTKKELPKDVEAISHKLLLRADFISQLASGSFSFLPLGWRVHKKIENIIREEIEKIGGQEVFLPSLQLKEIWQKTGRWVKMDPPLFKLKDRHRKDFALGSTHEEVITELAKSRIHSYKDLPLSLYQIQNKFRNEMRFTGGLLRTREFVMKDLYSFHGNKRDLNNYLNKVIKAYQKIFKRCNLNVLVSKASGGTFAEKKQKTFEFQVPAKVGEDKVIFCKKCKWAINLEIAKVREGASCPKCKNRLEKINTIEVGHAFTLGTKYSKAFELYFSDKNGEKKLVQMGCYGIGLGRLMATIVEIHHDEKGIIWPKEVTPFKIHLIQIENTGRVKKAAEKLYKDLIKRNIEVLYDDRLDKTAGEKFVDCDLIGIPTRIIVSERTLQKNSVELKQRSKEEVKLIKIRHLLQFLNEN